MQVRTIFAILSVLGFLIWTGNAIFLSTQEDKYHSTFVDDNCYDQGGAKLIGIQCERTTILIPTYLIAIGTTGMIMFILFFILFLVTFFTAGEKSS